MLQTFHKNGRPYLSAGQSSFSLLTSAQGRTESLLDISKLTCLVNIHNIRCKVTFSTQRRKFVPQHKKDGVHPDWVCVFDNNMNRYHNWGQLFITGMAIPIYGMSFNTIVSAWHLQDFSVSGGILTPGAYLLLYSILFFGVHTLCRRNIKRIYTDETASNYAAVVQDWKMRSKTITFSLDNTRRLPPGRVWGSFFGNVNIKGRPYMLMPTDFVQPKFYNLIMGYDLQRSSDLDIIPDIDIRDLFPKSGVAAKPPKKKQEQT